MRKIISSLFLIASIFALIGCSSDVENENVLDDENTMNVEIETISIYGRYVEDMVYNTSIGASDLAISTIENWYRLSSEEEEQLLYSISAIIGEGYGQYFLDAIKNEDVHTVENILQKMIILNHQNIMVGTLSNYRVAYISFNYLPLGWPIQLYAFALPDFFESVRDYGHLIVDLRGTRGDINRFFEFFRYIIRPNISNEEGVSVGMYFFTNDINLDDRFYSPITDFSRWFVENNENTLAGFDLPCINVEHVRHFDYVARDVAVFLPFYMLPENNPFTGQIWILIDSYVEVGAQAVAWISQASGFAYLAGEAFSFDIEALRIQELEHGDFHVTDVYGHALDKITPDYLNHPNMDALQTTLSIILNQ